MDFSQLYVLRATGKRTALHVTARDDIEDALALFLGEYRPPTPLVFHHMKGASGSTAHDLVSTSFAILDLVSDRLVTVLGGFTGWTTYPVEVYGKHGELLPGYHGLAVTGRCGPIDDTRSERRLCVPPVPEGRVSWQWFGLYFDPQSWDGSDVFVPDGTALMVIVEAVKQAVQRAGITNVSFEALKERRNQSRAAEFL